ncbi:Regulator of rDNA transcription protein 15 [Capsicum baccatum]|uniref:Regulator of rDNA transcription protein 15 n=1 Tax=Capsicum baccatum TaxID=33114 RepID=A0A2G2V089_CAPBA|nr:Regulator of rDNA transcription protein 15 [Capsicum baccatum]
MASGATCVQGLDGSRDSAIHTKYRISQCSSSMPELRYPLSRVIFVYRSTGPPDARRGRGARGRLSIQVFLGVFRARVCWSPAALAGVHALGLGRGARAECRSTPPARTPQLLNTFIGSFCCVGFDNDPSAGSPTETLLRLLLPLNDKVQWTSCDVAGSEPPTSTRFHHFTVSFNRQIAPPIRNGHAPPPIESRKSSQSVNPYYVCTCLNPAHVPYWWVKNPTLGEFCFTMIGRADIEGSKSNVAMNAWLPQASYPCGNFSDTSSFEFRRSKGSLGHAFTVRIRTGNQNQTSFYPSVPHEISVLVELILGHLRYLLTDVPPEPNSPPDNVFRPDRPVERALGPKRGAVLRFRFTE